VNADTYELKTILTLERRYVIPTFQRDYEWTESGQWALLFEDLEAVVDRLEDARKYAEAVGEPVTKADKRVSPHFLGAVVLDLLPSSAGSLDLRAVVDGQQRLTTLQLLIRGILDVLVELGSLRENQVRRLIQNPSDVVRVDDERYKLWPRRLDRDVWRHAMAEEYPAHADHLYLKARRFFRDRARVAMKAPDGADRSDVVVDALLSLFKLVVIDLEDNDDAQVIFEVLNGRQTPLSATDLVKNLLFLRAELLDEVELEALYDLYWAPFDDPWWRKEIGRGHAARGRRDVLLSSWLTAATRTEVNVGHLYGEVRHYLDNDHKIVDILSELSAAALEFRVIFDPPETVSARIADSYCRIVRLMVTTALPLLVWLRTLPPDRLSSDDHLRAVIAVDSWIMRRLIVGANTRGYGKHFVDVLSAARLAADAAKSVADAVETSLLAAGTGTLGWPTDDELDWAFVNRKFYNNLSQERLRMLLGAIDLQMHLDHPKGEHPKFDYDTLQIEHIFPQTWRDYWPLAVDDQAKRTLLAQERDRARDRIGNLTLVTGSLNSPMSNGAWSDKRKAIAEHSNLRLNAGLPELETWDENAIEMRARDLAAVARRVWPRPASS
jgi:hypothetical protein